LNCSSEADAEVYIDGAARGNPGPAGIGIVITLRSGPKTYKEYIGVRTNNEAEYVALIRALRIVGEMGLKSTVVYSDSELLVKQMAAEYSVRNERLRELYEEAKELVARLRYVRIIHVDRDKNALADRLANEAIDEAIS